MILVEQNCSNELLNNLGCKTFLFFGQSLEILTIVYSQPTKSTTIWLLGGLKTAQKIQTFRGYLPEAVR